MPLGPHLERMRHEAAMRDLARRESNRRIDAAAASAVLGALAARRSNEKLARSESSGAEWGGHSSEGAV